MVSRPRSDGRFRCTVNTEPTYRVRAISEWSLELFSQCLANVTSAARNMGIDLVQLNDLELVGVYSALLAELKRRGIIRSDNVVGDLGEFLALGIYNTTRGLPKLTKASTGTTNVDALGSNGARYTIKAT